MDGMKQHIRQGRVNDLVVYGQHIADRFAGLVIEQAVDLLKVRCGDFLDIFRYLDLGNDFAAFVFNSG